MSSPSQKKVFSVILLLNIFKVIFSHHAVITLRYVIIIIITITIIIIKMIIIALRNSKLCLIFRIGDLRDDNFILGTQVKSSNLK